LKEFRYGLFTKIYYNEIKKKSETIPIKEDSI